VVEHNIPLLPQFRTEMLTRVLKHRQIITLALMRSEEDRMSHAVKTKRDTARFKKKKMISRYGFCLPALRNVTGGRGGNGTAARQQGGLSPLRL
jgi:hypothetical protein